MIVDDLAAVSPFVRKLVSQAFIVRVPWSVFPFDDSDGHPGLLWTGERIPEAIMPLEKESRGVIGTWTAPPYTVTVIASTHNEKGFQVVIASNPETFEKLCATKFDDSPPPLGHVDKVVFSSLLIGKERGGWIAIPATATKDGDILGGVMVDGVITDAARNPEKYDDDAVVDLAVRRAAAMASTLRMVQCDPPLPDEYLLARASSQITAATARLHIEHNHRDILQSILTLATTFTMLNTKNVVTEPVDPSPKLQKVRKKNGKLPLYRYHVLKVRLDQPHSKGTANKNTGATVGLNWHRGHFKTYTKEKPLFGKYDGVYWWQPFVAGTADRVIEKEYEIA